MEVPSNLDVTGQQGNLMESWFVAPATTRYRFYVTGDDFSALSIDTEAGSTVNATKHVETLGWNQRRDWWEANINSHMDRITDWIELEEGEHYYMEGKHYDGGGGDHYSVAVEIEATEDSLEGHHHSMKEIQYLSVYPEQTFEVTKFTVTNFDDGEYIINLQHPTYMNYTQSLKINAKSNHNQFRSAIQWYYQKYFGTSTTVNRTLYDADGFETDSYDSAVEAVYMVRLNKLINGMSVGSILISKVSTSANIVVAKPNEVQVSAEPLSGKFQIKCRDKDGYESLSTEQNFNQHENWINHGMMIGCNQIYDLTEVFDITNSAMGGFPYRANGRAFLIRFQGFNHAPGQFEIVSSESSPLGGTGLTYYSNVTVPHSNNLFYEPIPFEMLKTFETKPQLIVTVDDVPAVCHGMNCDFTYVEPVGSIDSFTFDINTGLVSIQGTDLPTNISDIFKVEFALSKCNVDPDSLTGTSLECTLVHNPTCGDHVPIVTSSLGKIPPSADIAAETVSCEIIRVFPYSQLNLLGGDNVTLEGNYFPYNLEDSTVSITFSDDQATECVPQKSSSNELVCLTNPFDEEVAKGDVMSLTVIINGQTVGNDLTVSMMDDTKSGMSLNPPSASPVLKTQIMIQLETDFPYELLKEEFTVNATSQTNSSYIRYMNVISVDDDAKQITCMFGGAYSGLFDILIRHKHFGRIQTKELVLDVSASVTSYTPTTGSIYGGTLLTITGENFGNTYTDNPVQISTHGGVGSIDCYVQTTMATQITCRVGPTNQTAGQAADMVVFLKTSEEAKCEPSENCDYVYTSVIPNITETQLVFNVETGAWQIQIDGTGFTGDTTTTELYLDGIKQTTAEVSETQVLITLTNVVSSQNLTSQTLYFDVGTPESHSVVQQPLLLTPKLMSVSTQAGTIGGTRITAHIPGIIQGQDDSTTLVNADGTSICQSVSIPSYGVLLCDTLEEAIAENSQLSVQQDEVTYECQNADVTLCNYHQLEEAAFPEIVSVAKTDSGTITFTGVNFEFADDYIAGVTFSEVPADTVVVDSDTLVTATFTRGIPPVISAAKPILFFTKDQDDVEVIFAQSTATLENPFTITESTSGLECSFAGGCTYEITADGLSSQLSSGSDQVTVCDEVCEFLEDQSTASVAKCKLPKISTIYSNTNFLIAEPTEDLDSGNYFARSAGYFNTVDKLFDNNLLNLFDDRDANCVGGMYFKEGHVGMISQVKMFFENIANYKQDYADHLKFQGSQDNSTWVELFMVDEKIHDGWNYFKWETPEEYPKYRFYRISGDGEKRRSCRINEITFTGVETMDNEDSSLSCPVKIKQDGVDVDTELNSVTYQGELTPNLTAISPRYGRVEGGDSVTFTGTGFSSNIEDYTILIDGIFECEVTAATSTSVTCTTASRPGLHETQLYIYIDGVGEVSTHGLVFRYVSFWSSDSTWGGEFAPMEDETIYIPPGLNLLVDVDRTPVLNLVLVEGSLIFAPSDDPEHERFFDAHYIFVSGGTMEVGTEEFPYTSQLTITMHSSLEDPYLPIYGNKVIGVRHGTLDMHGIERTPVWTKMENSLQIGESVITLADEVDWQPGEQIAIASTSFDGREGEKRTILSIDETRKIITLDEPVEYRHNSGIFEFGEEFIDLRAEVGLLTRNVKYRGDPETSLKNQYGATIFLHSQGDDSLIARLSFIECHMVGQAFKLGRYAIHFHMIGAVHKSYAQGIGLHSGFNRAFTIHGTHYLRIMNNVAFEVKGHTVFIEDAIETKNKLIGNLIIKTMRSWSLLNTDQTPACFWITHPDNDFIGNHAAGSDRYGFWYDLQIHSMGPHANTNVCPENDRVGQFSDNAAHSMGRYGLRLFHNMVPREYPCKPIVFDPETPDDPYWQNRPITAYFENFTGWKNNRNGAIAKTVGDVRFLNFKTADNIETGIEMSVCEWADDMARVENALVIGMTDHGAEEIRLQKASPYGIQAPRTDNFQINDVRFYNFNWNNASCLSTCSHCWHPKATDSGARTIKVRDLWFDEASITKKIFYEYPWKAIFHDTDGSLTGLGPDSWATYWYPHLNVPECTNLGVMYDGVICDPSIQVRRIAFWNQKPTALFVGMLFKIIRYDDDFLDAMTEEELDTYIADKTNYGSIYQKEGQDPNNAWTAAFATNHKYKIHFGEAGLDFMSMNARLSQMWNPDDHPIHFVHNHTEQRDRIDVFVNDVQMENDTIADNYDDLRTGQYHYTNATQILQFIATGREKPSIHSEVEIKMQAYICGAACLDTVEEPEEEEQEFRYWSEASSWPNETLPEEGDNVIIEPGWKMIFDLGEDSPEFGLISVNGQLIFSNETDTHLKAKHIFVRAGEIHIGNETHPHYPNATITLMGAKTDKDITFENTIEPGNKVIANYGLVKMYGQTRKGKMRRLTQEALKGDTEIYIETGLDIRPGDSIGIGTTSFVPWASDDGIVQQYDNETGKITLQTALENYHFGRAETTGDLYNGADIRAEVVLLTRNVKIQGEDVESWGCQIVTGDTIEADLTFRQGSMYLDNVEIYNCSQIDTFNAALRFENAAGSHSSITNCAIHHGFGWGANIINSQNIHMEGNVWYRFRPMGVSLDFVRNVTLHDNIVMHIVERTTFFSLDSVVDKRAGIAVCTYYFPEMCYDVTVTNNIVSGGAYAGFLVPGFDCDEDESTNFKGNVAHSIEGFKGGVGAFIYPDPAKSSHSKCYQAADFISYKNSEQGACSYFSTEKVIFKNMTMIDNRVGFGAQIGMKNGDEYIDYLVEHNDNMIWGESISPDCPQNGQGGFCKKYDKIGMSIGSFTFGGKPPMITGSSGLPPLHMNSPALWGGKFLNNRNTFTNFQSQTREGMSNAGIGMHKDAHDLTPIVEFYDTTFIDVDQSAVGYFTGPDPGKANVKDCGDFPCTGKNNILLAFQDTTWFGTKPTWSRKDFQLIANNDGFGPYVDGCTQDVVMNAYICDERRLGVLMFESMDEDRWDRSMQPIYVRQQGTEMNNKINAMQDNVWDGFYAGQQKLSRFGSVFNGEPGSVYDIVFTGTPAKLLRFKIDSYSRTAGATIRIAYPGAESRSVAIDGSIVEMNQWNENLQQYDEIGQNFCGENRYIGVQNILEFYLKAGCEITIQPRDAIQTLVRMEWTMDEFFDNGGTTAFVDRVAGSLGIHASEIKVVSVYEGSLVLNYDITPDEDSEFSLEEIEEKQTEQFATGAMDLGAPILDVEVAVSKAADTSSDTSSSSSTSTRSSIISGGVVTAAGYEPITITKSVNTGAGQTVNVWEPNLDVVTEETLVTYNVTVYKEKAVETRVESKIVNVPGEETIIQKVIKVKNQDESSNIILIIALIIFALILMIVCGRFIFLNSNKASLEAQRVAEKRKVAHFDGIPEDSIDSTHKKIKFAGDKQDTDRGVRPSNLELMHSAKKEEQFYEQQYDPNQDFQIFTIGNQKLGGVQSLQEKMNMADADQNSSSSSEEEDLPEMSDQQPQNMKKAGDTTSTNISGSKGSKSNEVQIAENDLPEDKEIQSDDEED